MWCWCFVLWCFNDVAGDCCYQGGALALNIIYGTDSSLIVWCLNV